MWGADVTDADEMPIDDDFEDVGICPRKYHWAMLPAMIFNLFANFSMAWKQFFDEISGSFFAHSTFKTEERKQKAEARKFTQEIQATLSKL